MKLDWITFWIGALATYRLTVLISRDRGPDKIFSRLRKVNVLREWAKCPFCVSPYSAAVVATVVFFSGVSEPLGKWILLTLAWSAITIALDRTFSADVTND